MELSFFNILVTSIIICASLVIYSNQPITAVLALILTCSLSSFLLISQNLDFWGLILLNIYVGAIAVFFLFIIMMLDLSIKTYYIEKLTVTDFFLLICFYSGVVLFVCFYTNCNYFAIGRTLDSFDLYSYNVFKRFPLLENSLEIIATTLYTTYGWYVLISGFILFFAMVGSMVLLTDLRPSSFISETKNS